MVLELKVPHGNGWKDLAPMAYTFLSYALSYLYVGIYWNNHHHMFQMTQKVNGRVMWTNLFLLFWLSLIPFTTAWFGQSHLAALPTALYGLNLLLAGFSYTLTQQAIIDYHGSDSLLATAVGSDLKGKFSLIVYLILIPISMYASWLATILYVVVALTWLVPDKRIERSLTSGAIDNSISEG